jgi:hypothetical protein
MTTIRGSNNMAATVLYQSHGSCECYRQNDSPKYTPRHMKMSRIVRIVPTESERAVARVKTVGTVKAPGLKHPEQEIRC